LLRLGADEHQLLITTHHIACDGWSMGIFYRELAVLYEAFVQGQPSALPELPVSYGDFAGWQREWLRGEALENQIAFWKQQLSGPLPVLDLPTDRPRPALQTYRGATKHFALPTTLTSALLALSRQQDVTLFMLLLAAFQTLLHRCTGQEDIIVGTPIAGRTRVETEGLIGFFLNTLARRGDLSGDPAFSSLLKRTRRAALDAYPHEDLPFEKLVDALQLERDLSRSPLFQVMFILQNEPLRPLELPGLKLTPLPVHSGTSKFDCTLSLEQSGGTLAGYVEYNTDLFEAATIERMVGHFQTLLEGIVTNPEARLSALPLLTGADRKQLLVDWNETRTDFPKDKCVHELFEDQVGRTPDKVAVVFDDAELTYRELNDRANRLADELRSLGVGPEVRVGLCVERSFDMMVSLLGILKAGGCYVPLDPTYPAERLAFMLEDSQATVLLTQESLRDGFNFEILNLRVVCLDAAHDASRVLQRSAKPQSDNLAYVLYTSGSTGKPKGVMVTHRNVVNFFTGMDRVLGTKPGVWLAVTSISFDISVLELFWTLARGFKVIIQPNEEWSRPAESRAHDKSKNGQWRSVPEQILRHDVTHMQCTPSLAGALTLAPASLEATRRLSKLLLGGEALPVSLAAKLRQTLRGDLLNMYGPTETTVWSATHRVGETGGVIPIGRPIANTEMYILDQHLQPTPAGVPGELFIGGEGVARGYLNRPELTAERFIRHPFSTDSGARLYRTGDRARYGADGTIEFMGRFDHQIKLRGHRIELGEIESVLRRHSLVRECVALVREDVPGDQRLVAYVVASTSEPAAGQALHSFLAGKLPDYMVPSAFMFLDALPLTPNKKVDRKALPKPDGPCTNFDTAFVSPRTSKEKVIAGIWRELLQVQRVGLHDNFFDLGGHSLLVVQAQSRLRDALGVEVPVVKLFQYPTVRTLAQFVGGELKEHDGFDKIHARVRRQKAVFARGRELQAATP
jgi:amino acid adenylation domain-containing protein